MSLAQLLEEFGVPSTPGPDGLLTTTILIHNEEQLRQLLDIGLRHEQRAEHARALLDGIAAPADASFVALVHKLIRYAVGNDALSEQDRAELAPTLPITVHVITQATAEPPKAADPPMVVNYVWDVSKPDGSLQVIDLPGGLVLQDGGCVVARSTPLQFTCTSLVRTGGRPAGYLGDFNILGRKGAAVPTPPTPKAPGQAQSGAPGQCSSAGIAGPGGGQGTPGAQGTTGAPGGPGNPGIASSTATITIKNTLTLTGAATPFLVIATQSGPGGDGGDGGQGGPGQQGGNGGDGVSCGCTGNGGGSAAQGGKGGTGGPAGPGGDGVDAAGGIMVYVPASVPTTVVQPIQNPAPPGQPGKVGGGGTGGPAGSPGGAGKHNNGGGTAGPGGPGDPGATSHGGTHTGVPAQITPGNY